jgi:phage recombination protein Bet
MENAFQLALSRTTEDEMSKVLSTSLYVGAQPESIKLVISYCKVAGLDPLQKPVHIVPMYDSKIKGMRDVLMPSVGYYRIQASRSGECLGMSEPEFGPDVTETIGGVQITYPKWCKLTAYRSVNGVRAEFPTIEFWKENYAVKGGAEKSIAPNSMWQKRPYAQLVKCAESQAWRKAFPEVGSAPTAEEMEGKEIELNAAPIREAKAESVTDVDVKTGEVLKPHYADDAFDANFPKWIALIESGKKTAEQIIAMVESKAQLSTPQRDQILSIKAA